MGRESDDEQADSRAMPRFTALPFALSLALLCVGTLGVSLQNNTCMDASTVPPAGPKTFDCRGFVIESTDMTWRRRDWATTEASITKYFAPGWQSVRAYGTYIKGLGGLRSFMKEWLAGFPDVFIYMSDL